MYGHPQLPISELLVDRLAKRVLFTALHSMQTEDLLASVSAHHLS